MKTHFHCCECDQDITFHQEGFGGTGFAVKENGGKVCYECCAKIDTASMIEHGRAVLYLTLDNSHVGNWGARNSYVGNWPGTLKFRVRAYSTGRHNIAGIRYDVWFRGPDGHVWWGVTYGNFTQLCHCKRTKERCQELQKAA